jgi:hypothetical protein
VEVNANYLDSVNLFSGSKNAFNTKSCYFLSWTAILDGRICHQCWPVKGLVSDTGHDITGGDKRWSLVSASGHPCINSGGQRSSRL